MKVLLGALAAAALVAGCSTVSDAPVGMRSANHGFEYYSNAGGYRHDTGCVLPWTHYGHATWGHNPKRIDIGNATIFYDCDGPKDHGRKHKHVHAPAPAPAPVPVPAPPVAAPPAPAPAPVPTPPQPLPVKE